MSDLIEAFNPGWVRNKKGMIFSENFKRIIEFYLFSTPCDLVSSSSHGLSGRNWGTKPWSTPKLRSYLLQVGEFEVGSNYFKANKGCKKNGKQSNMSDKVADCHLNGRFHTKRKNGIVFLSSGQHSEFIDIFYYIRCSLAHGRFIICDAEDPVYILESAKKHKDGNETNSLITARMIINESTLIKWADIIDAGITSLQQFKQSEEHQIKEEIIDLIFDDLHLSKEMIVRRLHASHSYIFTKKDIREAFDSLKKEGRIAFSPKRGIWLIND